MRQRFDWRLWVVLPLCLYVGVACLVYGLRHPEMTDMQRFYHMVDALLWR